MKEKKTSGKKFVVVGIGEILWDMLPAGKQLGGAPANFAYHAHVLGAESYAVSCAGDDDLGDEIIRRVEDLGLDSSYIARSPDHPTGTVDVQVDAEGKPQYVIHENVAWDFIPESDALLELAARADAVCFGSLCQRSEVSRNTIRKFLAATRPDCLRVFDLNIRQSFYCEDVVRESLECSSVLKLNDEEVPVLQELIGEQEASVFELMQRGLQMVAVTMGANGSFLTCLTGSSKLTCLPVAVADTVGAGDAFTAALVMGRLQGCCLEEIHKGASALARYVCSQSGGTPPVPQDLLNNLFSK